MRAKLTFRPQAWINDYGIEVDPQGETTWEDDIPEGMKDDTFESDDLRFSPTAPAWVQEWSGPFYIQIEYITEPA